MPFRSKSQWRAAFANKIPGISADQARDWAQDTNWDDLPEKSSSLGAKTAAFFSKLSFAVPKPGAVRLDASRNVGGFSGHVTENFLKPPGPAASRNIVNPNRSVRVAANPSRP